MLPQDNARIQEIQHQHNTTISAIVYVQISLINQFWPVEQPVSVQHLAKDHF